MNSVQSDQKCTLVQIFSYILFYKGRKILKQNLSFQPVINEKSIEKFKQIVSQSWLCISGNDYEILFQYKTGVSS